MVLIKVDPSRGERRSCKKCMFAMAMIEGGYFDPAVDYDNRSARVTFSWVEPDGMMATVNHHDPELALKLHNWDYQLADVEPFEYDIPDFNVSGAGV